MFVKDTLSLSGKYGMIGLVCSHATRKLNGKRCCDQIALQLHLIIIERPQTLLTQLVTKYKFTLTPPEEVFHISCVNWPNVL